MKEKVFQFTQCELYMSCITHSRNTYFFLSFYDLLLQFTVTDNPLVSYKILKSNTNISIKSLPRKKHWDTELEHIFHIFCYDPSNRGCKVNIPENYNTHSSLCLDRKSVPSSVTMSCSLHIEITCISP